ncbi:MAG: diguanylate cyclase domain-containing protein [Alphaproteobacteria bacterium]
MKILVVDRDAVTAQFIKSKLEPLGHSAQQEVNKNEAQVRVKDEKFDMLFFDPSPLRDARPSLMNIRRGSPKYLYILLMGEEVTRGEALQAGANDVFIKPYNPANLTQVVHAAEHLLALVARIGDGSEDFPSGGGVIAKSAFNQLFLSALDRADRYGESTFILFISLSNYAEIKTLDGAKAADHAAALLSRNLVRLRRQSDIIGQTARNEFALMLQRPQYPSEPLDAAARFAQNLSQVSDMGESGAQEIEFTVSLVNIPEGQKVLEQKVKSAK